MAIKQLSPELKAQLEAELGDGFPHHVEQVGRELAAKRLAAEEQRLDAADREAEETAIAQAEATRIAQILGAPEANHQRDYAISLALETDIPATDAVALLAMQAITTGSDNWFGVAMALQSNPDVYPDCYCDEELTDEQLVCQTLALYQRERGNHDLN